MGLTRWLQKGTSWHSWDPHPWKHPWLTQKNLRDIKAFSSWFLEREKSALEQVDPKTLKVAFCGNIANCMYVRAVPLRRAGMTVDIFLHPGDTFLMSQPSWEEYDGTAPSTDIDQAQLEATYGSLPAVEGVFSYQSNSYWQRSYEGGKHTFMRPGDGKQFPSYMCYIDTCIALQRYDVLWGTQVPYLAYLANRPYVVSQMGGDFWLDASRNDELGAIMRTSFAKARINLVSNPWVFSHARRFGMTNLVYLPKIIDQEVYSPAIGPGPLRNEWQAQSGGDFFVLTSSRLDERNKGSSIGIEGFASLARDFPKARLVVMGWGNDRSALESRMEALGIQDKVIRLPVAGKARLRATLRSADVFLDQFVVGYFGSAGMEAMACGLPTIGRIETEQYDALCETGAPPILDAASSAAVTAYLKELAQNPERRKQVSHATRQWFVENHGSERWYEEHAAVLAATAIDLPADFTSSPLVAPLGLRERHYHLEGHLNAPKFPNYTW